MSKTKYAEQLEQPSVPETVWKAALYIRLSREDGDKAESDSVTFQREMLKEYVKQRPDTLKSFWRNTRQTSSSTRLLKRLLTNWE